MNKSKMALGLTILMLSSCVTLFPINSFALSKNETVYVKTNNIGQSSFYSVREHIVNEQKTDKITIKTRLTNLKNLNSLNDFSLDGQQVSIATDGKDLYYAGETKQTLPISFEIEYRLDGKKVNPNEIVGKNGKVETIFKFKNTARQGEVFTPFVIALSTKLDISARNAQVNNGAITSTGNYQLVSALSAPGLSESLDSQELASLDEIKISYDSENFQIPSYYMVVTPKLLSKLDLRLLDRADELYAMSAQMSEASQALADGSKQLASGTSEFSEKLAQYQSAFAKLSNSSASLNDNYAKINAGIQSLNNGAIALENALEQYGVNSQNVNRILSDLAHSEQGVKDAMAKYHEYANVLNIKIDQSSLSDEEKTILKDELLKMNGVVTQLANSEQIKQLETLIDNSAKFQALVTKAQGYQSKIDQAVAGIHQLSAGSTQFANGLKTYTAGVDALSEKTVILETGMRQLNTGAQKLSDGVQEFDNKGIEKISAFVNGELKNKITRVRALQKLSDEYSSYLEGEDENIETKSAIVILVDSAK